MPSIHPDDDLNPRLFSIRHLVPRVKAEASARFPIVFATRWHLVTASLVLGLIEESYRNSIPNAGRDYLVFGGPMFWKLLRPCRLRPALTTSTSNGAWDLKLLRDPTDRSKDKIVAMEAPFSGCCSVMVAHYNLDGSFDTTFNTTGQSVIATLPGHSLGDWGMALQLDGSAVVTGYDYHTNSSNGSFLLRYTNTEHLDTTFGTDGSGIILFGTATAGIAYSIAIQANGKIVLISQAELGQMPLQRSPRRHCAAHRPACHRAVQAPPAHAVITLIPGARMYGSAVDLNFFNEKGEYSHYRQV